VRKRALRGDSAIRAPLSSVENEDPSQKKEIEGATAKDIRRKTTVMYLRNLKYRTRPTPYGSRTELPCIMQPLQGLQTGAL